MGMNLLITGGAGFIGSAYVRRARSARPADRVVTVDALTYAGNRDNLRDLDADAGHLFVHADIRDGDAMLGLMRDHAIDAVVNLAAESHVDRSLAAAAPFVASNVAGTVQLLEAARAARVGRFLQVSTDEVYGTLPAEGAFDEASPLAPRNPYAASKAAADGFVLAYHHTFAMDVVIARACNNYGPRQYPEKLIPLMILNALDGRPLPVYGDGRQVRDWIHVDDHCEALDTILLRGRAGEVYNVGAETERTNLEVVRAILRLTGGDERLIRHVPDRLGHDRRYATNPRKLRERLGWRPRRDFEHGLAETVAWYRDNRAWAARAPR